MRKPVTFSVLFLPRFEKESKGKTPLYARLTVNNKRTLFSLQRNFTTSLWDPNNSRLKGSCEEALNINVFMDQVQIQITEVYRQLLKEKKLITPLSVKARYLGQDEVTKTLLQLVAYHNFNMKEVLKYGTLKNYYSTENVPVFFMIITFSR